MSGWGKDNKLETRRRSCLGWPGRSCLDIVKLEHHRRERLLLIGFIQPYHSDMHDNFTFCVWLDLKKDLVFLVVYFFLQISHAFEHYTENRLNLQMHT